MRMTQVRSPNSNPVAGRAQEGSLHEVARMRSLVACLEVMKDWVAVKDFELSHHNSKTKLFTIYPEYVNLN